MGFELGVHPLLSLWKPALPSGPVGGGYVGNASTQVGRRAGLGSWGFSSLTAWPWSAWEHTHQEEAGQEVDAISVQPAGGRSWPKSGLWGRGGTGGAHSHLREGQPDPQAERSGEEGLPGSMTDERLGQVLGEVVRSELGQGHHTRPCLVCGGPWGDEKGWRGVRGQDRGRLGGVQGRRWGHRMTESTGGPPPAL